MKPLFFLVLSGLVAFVIIPEALAVRATSTNYIIESGEVTEGFNRSFGESTTTATDETTVSNFEVLNSFGQPAIGISTSSNYKILGGFLYFPAIIRIRNIPFHPSGDQKKGFLDTLFKKFLPFTVRLRKVIPGQEERIFGRKCLKADLNCDERVDIVDVSIMLYWWDKHINQDNLASLLDAKVEDPDLDGDKYVDITDLSIQLYYWTG